jgi:tRNA guanosine-2'-O-methyltransferase
MQTQAEVCLAAYEALVPVLKVLSSTYCSQSFHLIDENEQLFSETEGGPQLDRMCVSFVQNINDLLGAGILARTRRAVLLDIKVVIFLSSGAYIFLPYDFWNVINLVSTWHMHFFICFSNSIVPGLW